MIIIIKIIYLIAKLFKVGTKRFLPAVGMTGIVLCMG